MKMIIQADDYGITPAVADGIVACAKEGMMTQTGIFTNMPWVEYAVERSREVPHLLLGQDLNISTGGPVTDPKLIPSLVQENGQFLTSSMHKAKDKENRNHVSYDEVLLEYDNQVKRFIELTGRLPGYIGGHAWGNDDTERAMDEICQKYGVLNLLKTNPFPLEKDLEMNWARPVQRDNGVWEFNVMTQVENDPLKWFKEGRFDEILNNALENMDVFMLHTHAGYLDRPLLELSSYNMLRAMEAGFLMSDELKQWVRDNNVELVNCLDVEYKFKEVK
ncbi:MAG: ChbG/HpnK family deacetylase [Erysipelotrichaceae bacterium]|nr:ChbG/HpnK family deacetylase [Erysipelotrichaceae bacterium]